MTSTNTTPSKLSGYKARAKGFVIARLKEPTTWAGLIAFVAYVLGVNLSPKYSQDISSAIVAVLAALLAGTPDGGGSSLISTNSTNGK